MLFTNQIIVVPFWVGVVLSVLVAHDLIVDLWYWWTKMREK